MEVGQILKAIRQNSKMNVHDFVMKSGISRAWVYKVEKGEVPSPSVQVVRKWLSACKPKPEQKAETAEWMRLGMLLIFNESGELDEQEQNVESIHADAEPPKKGWISRVMRTALKRKN